MGEIMGEITDQKAKQLIEQAEKDLRDRFFAIDEIAYKNQCKVTEAFRQIRLTEEFFVEKTGYAIDDPGRIALDQAFAIIFGAQRACVRMQFVSGTHALACAILGNIAKGDKLVTLTGAPYDSLEPVLGLRDDEPGNMKSLGASYVELDLNPQVFSADEIKAVLKKNTGAKIYYIQKSRGYSVDRKSLSQADIKKLIDCVRETDTNALVLVDNCYGEFVEELEPTAVGANLVAGSLIKNPGGGLAITGGYLAGKESAVLAAANRLTAPGVGDHLGVSYNQYRSIFQGLFMAPLVVSQALKGASLYAMVFEKLGYVVSPGPLENRYDIIQSIILGSPDKLVEFCQTIQKYSPVNSHVNPAPAQMPGYQDEVVMAGGTFVENSTIEFSADGPLRSPYVAYMQGGLSYHHIRYCLERTLCESKSLEAKIS